MTGPVIVLILLGCVLFVTVFSAYIFDAPQQWADRRRCVSHRGEVAAILASREDHLCADCRQRLDRISALEWAMDAPLPPPSMANPSYVEVIRR